MSADTLAKYHGKLPDRLLEYWQEYGFCRFAKGLFWITNPEDYETILAQWLPDNVQQDGREYYFNVPSKNSVHWQKTKCSALCLPLPQVAMS